MSELKVILTAIDEPLFQAWNQFCSDFEFVEIFKGSILDVKADALVSPANSFGFMDGGIDALYTSFFGAQLQRKLQNAIREIHGGELLVGSAEIIETDILRFPFLIAAPTMRIPMILKESVNPYLAARAAFRLIKFGRFHHGTFQGNQIHRYVNSIAVPGLGTGVGNVSPATCAHQVRQAIEDVLLDNFEFPHTWAHASERHQLLYTDRPRNLQYE